MADLYNIAAEIGVLGAILDNNSAIEAVSEKIKPSDFYQPLHQEIFIEIVRLSKIGMVADGVTLYEWASKNIPSDEETPRDCRGAQYLITLLDSAAFGPEIKDYTAQIRDLSKRRETEALLMQAIDEIKADNSPADVVDSLERSLREMQAHSGDKWRWKDAESDEVVFRANTLKDRIPTGLKELDDILGGVRRGFPTVIAGRPSMGKSMVGVNIARRMAEQGVGVGYFSLEMGADMLWLRMACDRAFNSSLAGDWDTPFYFNIKNGNEKPHRKQMAVEAYQELKHLPLKIDDRSSLTPSEMHRWARRLARFYERRGMELGAIVVDHLQRVRPERERKGNPVAEMTDISTAMAEIAKDLNIAVIELCQLNRGVEQRPDKRPLLSDLRESGALEQDADSVILLYREAYYLERKKKEEGFLDQSELMKLQAAQWSIEMDVAKNRDGKTGRAELMCVPGANAITNKEAPQARNYGVAAE